MPAFREESRIQESGDGSLALAGGPPRGPSPFARWVGSRRLARPFWVFLLASCLFNTGMFVYVLLYNLFLLDLGYREDFLGLLSSFTTAGNIAGTAGAVLLTRRIGLQKTVAVCLFASAATSVLRALIVDEFALLGFAFLAGTFFALWAISIAVIIAQTTPEDLRPFAFSVYLATAIGIGIVADPLGGHLPVWLGRMFGPASPAVAKQWALLVGCAFVFLSVLPALFLKLAPGADPGRLRYPRSPFVLRFLAAVAVMNVATAAFNPFANAYFSQYLKMPVHEIGLVFSGGQAGQVIAILLSPFILKRLGLIWGIMWIELATGLSLALLATGPSAQVAVLGFAGYMAFQWMDEPAMESLLMTRVRPDERSGASSMMYMTIFASAAIAAPTSGKALTVFGYPTVLGAAAFLLMLGGLLFGLLLKGSAERAPENPEATSRPAG
ncbi:MAG TPA: MFS transporter [Blastocatellia bacterium]|nr:MFS transporter [Blastocatellia bacterium]